MEKDYKIKVTDTSKLNDHYKEAIQEGTYDGEDIDKFFNTIKTFDIAESLLKKDFSNQSIKFEIITDKEKIPLDIRLGDKNFQQGIEHLIKMGGSAINKEKLNDTIKKDLNKQLEQYKPKTYDKMLDGTFKALKNISEIANKDIAAMIQEFANSYLKTRGKYEQKKINNLAKEPSFFKQKMNEFFKKKLNKVLPNREISNEKTYSHSR
ncbi:NTPase [Campylobacter upsaliensis]|uniref:NTPase n=1 Tax=Campylobacter upsaliensis TaxID=28080 RepID=UPI0012798468|nr:NTPase [Campylobacter upsaliensis]EAH5983248.1 NTPase [Campylobacter upsaliensis]EAI2137269.1 NTPase [Campylobacter upsaliensis]EAI4327106.1 NTPase [Campylobacter upsaliensis]EAI5357713.1 NTPase [Campylobacter upsaliensis]EAI5602272.1 NTPase [Campylobacter upsaliensis]